MADLGYSFQPGGANMPMSGGRRPQGMTPQQAVRILSLRVPDRPSPTAPAPLPLLQSAGGGAAGAQGLQGLMRALMQAFQQPAGQLSGGPRLPQQVAPQPMAGPSPLPPLQDPPEPTGRTFQPEPTFQPGSDSARPGGMPRVDMPQMDEPRQAMPQTPFPQQREVPQTPTPGLIPHIGFGPPEEQPMADPNDLQAMIRRLFELGNENRQDRSGGLFDAGGWVAPGSDASDATPLF